MPTACGGIRTVRDDETDTDCKEETIFIVPPPAHHKFICAKCGRTFSHHPSLYRHLSMECQKKPQFHCPFCDYRSYFKYTLRRHFNKVHKTINCSFDTFFK
ncbi:unnamed protein product [Ceutorhynchus assimilis]|uniref:C2H2-type domain-containing protein n=1 Tax=Ceutorhynchus assimilis TaxID=467358 RepID=A0A9N9MHZ6_9CUCU|nr:unnamed protein product [Ceutorhynchus assimilis]